MHPDVVSDRPGSCPKCGMALEPRTVLLEEGPNPELVDMSRRFWLGLLLGLPIFILAMGHMLLGRPLIRRVAFPLVEPTLDRLIEAWLTGREDGESFRDFCIRTSDDELQAIASGRSAA